MSRKVIALISVLKPVDDSRNYHKIGVSLAQTNKYDLNIIGFASKKIPVTDFIELHPLFHFKRLSPMRLLAPWRIFFLLIRLKPDLIICTTHELLFATVLYKMLWPCRIIYDVQENYTYNILFSGNYPRLLRRSLAWVVEATERSCSRYIDLFILAEHSYALELPFENTIIVENKTALPLRDPATRVPRGSLRFIFAGTIAENYGVFDAIKFVSRLHYMASDVSLVIAGFSPKQEVLNRVRKEISGLRYVELIADNWPLEHGLITGLMASADFALLPYHLDRSLIHCIPTKMYECIALGLPMLVRPNPYWLALCDSYDSALYTDFEYPEPGLLEDLKHKAFYMRGNRADVRWESEKHKLMDAVAQLTGQ